MPGELVLAQTSVSPARLAKTAPGSARLLLIEDYRGVLRWDRALGGSGARVRSAPLIEEAAARLRRPFLELVTKLGRRHASLSWWASRVSERNTMVSPLFLHCCHLYAAQRALDSGHRRLLVVADSWAMLEALARRAQGEGWRVSWAGRRPRLWRRFAAMPRTLAHLARFLGGALRAERRYCRPAQDPGERVVLLRTWVDEDALGDDGQFRDRYHPGLREWLEEQGFAAVTLPVLFNLERSDREAWKWMAGSSSRFLNPHACYRPSDYLHAVAVCARQLRIPRGRLELQGLEVGGLFAEDRTRGLFDRGSLEVSLSYRLPLRLRQAGMSPEAFIDTYENMMHEKLINLGFRRYLEQTRLVNVQPAALYPNHLNLFLTSGEAAFAPVPDRVVCSGELFRAILVREGLPAERVVTGPALRYRHLWESQSGGRRGERVLVLLSLVPGAAAELLSKAVQAFGGDPSLRVDVKPHPMTAGASLLRDAGLDALPSNFELVGGTMAERLTEAAVVVSTATGSLYEALAAGVPVVVVGRDAALDFNPLGWFDDLGDVFAEPEAIREQAVRLLSLSEEALAAYRERGREILRSSFNPVTPEGMRSFLAGLERPRGH